MFKKLLLIICAVLVVAGCSKEGEPKAGTGVVGECKVNDCSPGDAEECTVDGGELGLHTCAVDCTWNPCVPLDNFIDTDSSLTGDTDTGPVFVPPEEACPDDTIELNVKNFWSADATPHLNGTDMPFDAPPAKLKILKDQAGTETWGAKLHPDNCNFYRTCIAPELTEIFLQPDDPDTQCAEMSLRSSPIAIPSVEAGGVLTITHEGSDDDLTFDYSRAAYENMDQNFTFSNETPEVIGTVDPLEYKPACSKSDDVITLHFRWPWGDPAVTSFAGTACESLEGLNTSENGYPPSLLVTTTGCADGLAVLERSDGVCPWYEISIPKSEWEGGNLKITYVNNATPLMAQDIDLPPLENDEDELWLVYEGPVDYKEGEDQCGYFTYWPNLYHFYTANVGPGYPGCGGAPAPEDCSEIKPIGYSVIHFRYMWAGQKTFTYFPKETFMPTSMWLHVNSKEYACVQEGDSPWFRCPIPNDEFYEGAVVRALDRSNLDEGGDWWTTVKQMEYFPTEPGTYWMRWYYGKPDIPDIRNFKVTDYYPDGVEWAETGSWGDDFCFSEEDASRPPIESDGFFPWNETNYEYGFGQSIAKWYDNPKAVQNLMNYFVWERYQIWKENYLVEGDDACGEGTARVNSEDSVSPTVSEGQGYGMAISAAIGDKETFDKLWRFVNHYLGQGDKYCGGLMGWDWKGPDNCQPYGSNAESGGGTDSAFDGDVDIAIGLVYAAWQWPEYTQDAVDWILKMECEVNDKYDGVWYYPTPGDTFNKNCENYPENGPCDYTPGVSGGRAVNMSYYPPGYFRVFGEFLAENLPAGEFSFAERINHLQFWYHTAESTWEMVERCYDDGIHPALLQDWGSYDQPCSAAADNYNWSRGLWRLAIDAAWYGQDDTFYSSAVGSSRHYDGKSQIQAKMDAIQQYYAVDFPVDNPGEEFANRFSTICNQMNPSGAVSGCDPAYDHNSYFVTTAMCSFATFYDNDGATTATMRKEALEEAVSVAIQDDKYYQESLGVYQLLFLTGNFPRPNARIEDQIIIID